jgi:hypothetical protein
VAVDSEAVFSFPGLEKRINEARKERRKIKNCNPSKYMGKYIIKISNSAEKDLILM